MIYTIQVSSQVYRAWVEAWPLLKRSYRDIFFRSPRFSPAHPPARTLLINNVLGSRRVAASGVAVVATKEKKKKRKEKKKIFFHRASEKLLMKPADATYGCIQLGPTSASMRDTPVLSFLSEARAVPIGSILRLIPPRKFEDRYPVSVIAQH